MLLTDFIITRGPPFHRGAFCQFPLGWFYYYGINKSTGKQTGKMHFCAVGYLLICSYCNATKNDFKHYFYCCILCKLEMST